MNAFGWQRAMALLGATLFVGGSWRVLRTLPAPPKVASETVNPAAVGTIQGQTAQWQGIVQQLQQSISQARAREAALRKEMMAAESSLAQLKSEATAPAPVRTAAGPSGPQLTLSQPLASAGAPGSPATPSLQVHAVTGASGSSERDRQRFDDGHPSREERFEHHGQPDD